uniref:Uncharacterized protein n=1 Tax=Stegastes partitus TaxID=144197 RepID=A0A3B5AFN6_9TELE
MFVGLNLQLQLVHQVLKASHVLAVFLSLVGELFDSAFILANPLNGLCSPLLLHFQLVLQLFDASFQFLELLPATLHCNLLGLIQSVLQVFDCLLHVLLHALQMGTSLELSVTLHLLLDPQGLISAPGLRFQRRLKRLEHSLIVPLGLLHFLVFLSHFTLHVSLHLVELQLGSEDLALFMFQRTFCLLQS